MQTPEVRARMRALFGTWIPPRPRYNVPAMAARTPRRSFAAPFVVTLAAPLAACFVQTAPAQQPHGNPPPDVAQQQQTPPPDHVIVSNPPRPTTPPPSDPPPQQQPTNPVIMNPPRPTPTTTPTQTTPTPPKQTSEKWTIFKQGAECMASIKTDCPQGVMCNPPPPTKYACPESTTLPLVIETNDGGKTCTAEVQATSCPKGAMCNPPRPRAYPCPTR